MSKYFASVHVGCYWITAVLAKMGTNNEYTLEGFSRANPEGFRSGKVVDFASASDTVSRLLNKLKENTNKNFHNVYTAVSSNSIHMVPSSGTLLLSKYGREISSFDIRKCVDIASQVKISLNEESLHKIIDTFSIDNGDRIKNPINLEGVKLDVKVNILVVDSPSVRNIAKCISHAGYMAKGFVYSPLAASYRVLNNAGREQGSCIIYLREDASDIVLFQKGVLNNCMILPVGVNKMFGEDGRINAQEVENIYSGMVSMKGWEGTTKIIVVSETILGDELLENFQNSFRMPVEVGICNPRRGEELPLERSGYIVTLGVLDYLEEQIRTNAAESNVGKMFIEKAMNFVDKYF